eukprot:1760537-Amphidinium_carterae.3
MSFPFLGCQTIASKTISDSPTLVTAKSDLESSKAFEGSFILALELLTGLGDPSRTSDWHIQHTPATSKL